MASQQRKPLQEVVDMLELPIKIKHARISDHINDNR